MHSQLDEALGRLDSVTRELHAAVAALPPDVQSRKPSPDRWCVNEVLEHLGMVDTLFVTRMVAGIDAAKAAGLGPEVDSPALLSDDMRLRLEDRTNRRDAPETVVPTGKVDADAAFATIEAAHTRLRDALATVDGLALSTIMLEHRIFGTLNVYQWIDLMAGHGRRHLAQLKECGAGAGLGIATAIEEA